MKNGLQQWSRYQDKLYTIILIFRRPDVNNRVVLLFLATVNWTRTYTLKWNIWQMTNDVYTEMKHLCIFFVNKFSASKQVLFWELWNFYFLSIWQAGKICCYLHFRRQCKGKGLKKWTFFITFAIRRWTPCSRIFLQRIGTLRLLVFTYL